MASAEGCQVSTAKVVEKEGQLIGELGHLNGSINRLSVLVERMEDKLSLVVTCVPSCTGDDSPDEVLVPMADTIRTQRRTVDSISNRVDNLINRIEL